MSGVTAAEDLVQVLNQPREQSSSKTLFTAPFTIKLAKVDFAYPERKNALSQVNLTFSQQGLYAVIGESGSGKSTLIDMVLGFVQPSAGQVTVNNNVLTGSNS